MFIYRKAGMLLAIGAMTSVVALAGCASGSSSQPPSGGSATSGAGAASSAAGTSGSSGSSGSSAGSGSSPSAGSAGSAGSSASGSAAVACTASQLAIAYTSNAQIKNGALDGMSKADHVVTFTNTGSSACVIGGFPGVAALNAAGAQIKQASRSGTPHNVTLKPGAVASSLISANTASCSSLTSVPGLLVTAPNQTTSVKLGSAGQFCVSSLTVAPVSAGDAGGLPF